MAWKCLAPGFELDDARADRKQAKRIEAHWISDNAVYFDGQYVPFAAIQEVHIQPSVYRVSGCCGRGVPVHKLCLNYGGPALAVLTFEKESKAQEVIDCAVSKNPAINVKQYLDPVTGLPPKPVPAAFM